MADQDPKRAAQTSSLEGSTTQAAQNSGEPGNDSQYGGDRQVNNAQDLASRKWSAGDQ